MDAHSVSPSMVTLSNVCSRPVRNSSSSQTSPGSACAARSQEAKSSSVSSRYGGLGPGAGRRLGHHRQPTSARKPVASSVRVTSWWRAHGMPALRSTDFIRDLSRTFSAVSSSMPGMPSAPRTWASGTCNCSSAPIKPLDRADLTAEAADGVGDLLGIKSVADLPVARQGIPQVRGEVLGRLGGDQAQLHTGYAGRREGEPRGGFEQIRSDECGDHHSRRLSGASRLG